MGTFEQQKSESVCAFRHSRVRFFLLFKYSVIRLNYIADPNPTIRIPRLTLAFLLSHLMIHLYGLADTHARTHAHTHTTQHKRARTYLHGIKLLWWDKSCFVLSLYLSPGASNAGNIGNSSIPSVHPWIRDSAILLVRAITKRAHDLYDVASTLMRRCINVLCPLRIIEPFWIFSWNFAHILSLMRQGITVISIWNLLNSRQIQLLGTLATF